VKQVGSLRTENRFKKTEIGRIPVDWEIVKLKDILSLNYGDGLPESKRKGDKYPVYGSNGIVGYHDDFLVNGPSIIVGRKGTIGSITWSDSNFWPIDTTYYVITDTSKNSLRWLYYQLYALKLNRLNTATGIPGLNRDVALNLKIPLPLFSEQKKIAEILTTVDEAIEKSKEIIEKTKELKKGLMQELLTRGIGHKKFKKTEIGEIPMEWEIVKLKDVAAKQRYAFVDGPFGSNLKTVHYTKQGVPVIQSQFIISGKFKPVETFFVSEQKAKELERSKVVPGDIVIAKIGVNYGASSTVPVNYPESVLSGNTMKITPNLNKVVTEFLQYVFHYFRMIKVFDKIVSTTAQPAITLKGAKNLKMSLPKISEQKKIAEILFSADEEIEKEIAHKERLEKIKKGLMQVLLTGKIRVKV
jgi:type I restriction enzyme, S subunit